MWLNITVFIAAGAVILLAGSRLTWLADRLADRTGLGEAVVGSLLLGASTSLPGIVTSVTAAWRGHAEMAVSNAVGGIAAQTLFLAVADIVNRKANLEHQAASLPNILNGVILMALLVTLLVGAMSPDWAVWDVHPISYLVFAVYASGMYLVHRTRQDPQWKPKRTVLTVEDEPQNEQGAGESSLGWMLVKFAILAALLGTSGWLLARVGIEITRETGLSETVVGGLFTAVTTSLPELVTVIAAVRAGALTLAVADILGGNAFDTLFVVAADFAYRQGSIYHAAANEQLFMMGMAALMTGLIVMGLVYRQEKGLGNIGFESVGILLVYVAGSVVIALGT